MLEVSRVVMHPPCRTRSMCESGLTRLRLASVNPACRAAQVEGEGCAGVGGRVNHQAAAGSFGPLTQTGESRARDISPAGPSSLTVNTRVVFFGIETDNDVGTGGMFRCRVCQRLGAGEPQDLALAGEKVVSTSISGSSRMLTCDRSVDFWTAATSPPSAPTGCRPRTAPSTRSASASRVARPGRWMSASATCRLARARPAGRIRAARSAWPAHPQPMTGAARTVRSRRRAGGVPPGASLCQMRSAGCGARSPPTPHRGEWRATTHDDRARVRPDRTTRGR